MTQAFRLVQHSTSNTGKNLDLSDLQVLSASVLSVIDNSSMEKQSIASTKSGTLPPIESGSVRKSKKSTKGKSTKVAAPEPKALDTHSKSSKQAPAKDLSAAHPAMIGVDIQSLHPFSSELIDGLYKRPVVVSMLVPKKKVKNFKYEPSKRAASPTNNTGGESDGQSEKRSPSRPSSRAEPRSDKKKPALKVFVIKVYDLVESKEGIFSVVVREFDKLLEELIQEEGSTAVCDYFQPQSLDWWAKSLRHVLITFDKPNGELSVAVDKKLIRKMVTYNMTHHVWMKANLTAEQIKAAKLERSESMKKRKTPVKRKSAADMELIMQELPWNDYTAMGERNPPPVQRAGTSSGTSSSSRLNTASVKSLPPVSRPKSPSVVICEVGDWVHANYKRAGQWYPGIVKKVYNHGEYYDVDYDDGRSESKLDGKLVRKSGTLRTSSQFDSVDLLSSADLTSSDPTGYGEAFSPGGASLDQSYDSAYNSAYENTYDSNYNSTYESANESATDVNYESTYEGDGSQVYNNAEGEAGDVGYVGGGEGNEAIDNSGYEYTQPDNTDGVAYDTTTNPDYDHAYPTTYDPEQTEHTTQQEVVFDEHALTDADYHIDGVDSTNTNANANTDEQYDYNNYAYDYTNQAVIPDTTDSTVQAHYSPEHNTDYSVQDSSAWEVADGAELNQDNTNYTDHAMATNTDDGNHNFEVSDAYNAVGESSEKSTRNLIVAYVSELIDSVVRSNKANSTVGVTDNMVQDEYAGYEYLNDQYAEGQSAEFNTASDVTHDSNNTDNNIDSTTANAHDNTNNTAAPAESEDTIGFESEISDFGSPVAKATPSQVALRSLLATMALEESSLESTVLPKSKKGKRSKKAKSAVAEGSSTSLILGTEASVVSAAESRSVPKPRTAGMKLRKLKPVKVPEGLFPVSEQRGKTAGAGSTRPPNIEEYVARAAASPPKVRANTCHKSSKSKKLKPKSAKVAAEKKEEKEIVEVPPVKQVIHGNGLAKLGKPATAPINDLHRGITFEGEEGNHSHDHGHGHGNGHHNDHDEHSVHSHHTHHSHNYLARGPHHHGPDAHGNFDHSDLPHYPYPHHTRQEQKMLAIEAITKPHSNPMDRYTYVMMPAPLHMLQPVHGHGHDAHHHGHHGHHPHGHHGDHSPSGHSSHSHHPHHGTGHGHHVPHDPLGEISPLGSRSEDDFVVHHSAPFEVRNILDQTMLPHHHHDFHGQLPVSAGAHGPAQFSETFHTGHSMPGSPEKHGHAHAHSSSLPMLPHIHRNSQSRPTSGGVDTHHPHPLHAHSAAHHPDHHGHSGAASQNGGHSVHVSEMSVAVTEDSRPMSRSKGRAVSPFAHKEKYRGPQRRVLDIIEWARVSTGGSEQKQNRKISKVEKRLLKSPLALKLIHDSPLNVADLIDQVHKP